MAEAATLAEHFRKNGFVYKGRGCLEGLIEAKLNAGYSKEDLLKAFQVFTEELKSRNKIKNHSGYYLTVLDSMLPYGPEKGVTE